MESVILYRTTEEDLQAVVELEADDEVRHFITPWPLERHRAAVGESDCWHLSVSHGGRWAGFAILAGLTAIGHIELRRLAVARRGQGIGAAALRAIRNAAACAYPGRGVWLDVRSDNAVARRLYENEGFRLRRIEPSAFVSPNGTRHDLAIYTLQGGSRAVARDDSGHRTETGG